MASFMLVHAQETIVKTVVFVNLAEELLKEIQIIRAEIITDFPLNMPLLVTLTMPAKKILRLLKMVSEIIRLNGTLLKS